MSGMRYLISDISDVKLFFTPSSAGPLSAIYDIENVVLL